MNAASALILGMFTINGAPQGEVLDFTAKWCGPCQSVAPVVEKLKRQGYPIRKIDVSEHPELVKKYRIDSIPQFVLIIDGKERTRVQGIQSESSLKRLLAQIPQAQEDEKPEEIISRNDAPRRIGGIPIPFLGQSKSIDPEDVETIRGQSESIAEKTAVTTSIATDPLQATVRLKVNINGSINKGTGTIIESTSDRTLAITCGHLFRHSNAQTKIAVDVFENGQPQTYQARLVRFDDRADVGLIAFAPQKILPRSRIATDPKAVRPRDLVASMGCGHGSDPTQWPMFVKSVDGYVGKSITECTQAPVEGRSGGGLFNRGGELIGICMAADKNNNTGLYAGLSEIHALLDQLSLTALYREDSTEGDSISGRIPRESPELSVADNRQPAIERRSGRQPDLSHKQLDMTVVSAKPVSLTEAEIAAIAAALQMSGPNGVSISIEDSGNIPGGHRVTIVNRVSRSLSTIAKAEPPNYESLDWANLLESRESKKTVSSTSYESPEWARDQTQVSDAPPFGRSSR